ncbi:MAG: CPBP family intramembrane metalloprotease [Lachnospiraceae bacterium]|nr:CPBP family intramembrane metalloprotease [Lachnospiraceae bacterium]
MKKNRVWAVFYPIFVYYLISAFVFFALNILLGETQEIYMLKQAVSSGATIPVLFALWKQDNEVERVVYGKEKRPLGQYVVQAVLACTAAGTFGVALNNFIAMTPLVQVSEGFQTANENFFGGGVWMQVLASCVVVPVAEELLFRGIVLKRVALFAGETIGIIYSALLFGLIHVNLVQFIYAALLGALLAVIVVKTKRISLAVLGHATANLIAILRTASGVLDFSYQPTLAGIGFSVAMVAIGVVAMLALVHTLQKTGTGKLAS